MNKDKTPVAGTTPMPPVKQPLFASLRHYARIYAALWQNSVVREMSFKGNFIMWILVECLWFVLQLAFIGVIYLHTERIGTWSQWEVVMLVGGSHFIQQVFQAIFLVNCAQVSELIRTGRLDFMLLLPVNTRFLVSFRQVDLGGFVNAAFGLCVMAYAAHRLHVIPAPVQIAGFLLLSVAGILIHYSLMFLLASTAFWTVRAQGIVWGYYNLFNIARLPDGAFKGFFKAFFRFAIPMLLVANVPVKLVLQKLESPFEMVLLVVMCAVCFIVSSLFWKCSIKRYTSASA
jgi:ABC-2 type transport system permease protein